MPYGNVIEDEEKKWIKLMKHSLTLASASASREEMLRNAGYDFDIMPADIDEEKIVENIKNKDVENAPIILATEKARYISNKITDNYIIGSDQVLIAGDKLYSKSKIIEDAKIVIGELQGKTHRLISAVSVYKDNKEIFSYIDEASLTMRSLSPKDIENYCDKAGNILTSCVGCYALEGVGLRLFQHIDGDYFTILGMPLLPLSNFLDKEGFAL